jgi:hypothetical protein
MTLDCPECGMPITIAAEQQVEGQEIPCFGCGAGFVLARETNPDHANWHWLLTNPDEESADER